MEADDDDQAAEGGNPMTRSLADEDLRALLLHQLPPDETAAIEQRLIVEDGLAERVQHQECELLDAYARGQLRAEERLAVRRYLLRTEADRQRLAVAAGLAQLSPPRPAEQPGLIRRIIRQWFGGSVPVALGAVLSGVAAVGLLAALLAAPARQAPQPSAAPAGGAAQAAYTISLLAGVARGAGIQTISIPPGTSRVRLQAEVEQAVDGAAYDLRIRDAGGQLLLAATGLPLKRAGARAYVETLLAADRLGSGLRAVDVSPETAGASSPQVPWSIRISTGG